MTTEHWSPELDALLFNIGPLKTPTGPISTFVTGSYAYGTPNANSDLDLVIPPCDSLLANILTVASDHGDYPIKFGSLNLIIPADLESYQTWKDGTQALSTRKPVGRDEAINFFDALFYSRGLHKSHHTPSGKPA